MRHSEDDIELLSQVSLSARILKPFLYKSNCISSSLCSKLYTMHFNNDICKYQKTALYKLIIEIEN